jgi:Ni/Co efflux regulator RcnB
MTSLPRRRRGLLTAVVSSIVASAVIALPIAGADPPQCNQTVGDSIDQYLQKHPDLHQQLQARAQAEGDNGNVIDYLNRHPDVRQHLIDLSQQCAPW